MIEKIRRMLLDQVIGRRSLVGKLVAGATALFASMLGFSLARGYNVQCCGLCCAPSDDCANPCGNSCPGDYCGNGSAQWCWICCDDTSDYNSYWCIENFQVGHYCICSYGCSNYSGPTGVTCYPNGGC
jgi:hypothetical protein